MLCTDPFFWGFFLVLSVFLATGLGINLSEGVEFLYFLSFSLFYFGDFQTWDECHSHALWKEDLINGLVKFGGWVPKWE